jgi:hypothetical protein
VHHITPCSALTIVLQHAWLHAKFERQRFSSLKPLFACLFASCCCLLWLLLLAQMLLDEFMKAKQMQLGFLCQLQSSPAC